MVYIYIFLCCAVEITVYSSTIKFMKLVNQGFILHVSSKPPMSCSGQVMLCIINLCLLRQMLWYTKSLVQTVTTLFVYHESSALLSISCCCLSRNIGCLLRYQCLLLYVKEEFVKRKYMKADMFVNECIWFSFSVHVCKYRKTSPSS